MYLGQFETPAAFQATQGHLVRGALVEAVGEAGDADLLPLLQLLLHPVSLVDEGESLQTADHGAARNISTGWVKKAVFKRRLIFVPLPEPGPLHSNNRGTLPGDEAPDRPLLDRRPLLQQGLLYHLEFFAGHFLIFLTPKLSLLVESSKKIDLKAFLSRIPLIIKLYIPSISC